MGRLDCLQHCRTPRGKREHQNSVFKVQTAESTYHRKVLAVAAAFKGVGKLGALRWEKHVDRKMPDSMAGDRLRNGARGQSRASYYRRVTNQITALVDIELRRTPIWKQDKQSHNKPRPMCLMLPVTSRNKNKNVLSSLSQKTETVNHGEQQNDPHEARNTIIPIKTIECDNVQVRCYV